MIALRFDSVKCIESMPLIEGGFVDWEFADPNTLLVNLVEHSPALNRLFTEAVRISPPSVVKPWSLVVGFDEFVPGNKLKVDNKRKTMVLSFSFLELGQAALSQGLAWQTPVCLRASLIHSVVGGWSHFLKVYLQRQLAGPCGLSTSGVALELSGQPVMLFARFTNLLSDGDGLKQALDWRGHGSFKPCFKHFNVFKKDRQFASSGSPL